MASKRQNLIWALYSLALGQLRGCNVYFGDARHGMPKKWHFRAQLCVANNHKSRKSQVPERYLAMNTKMDFGSLAKQSDRRLCICRYEKSD